MLRLPLALVALRLPLALVVPRPPLASVLLRRLRKNPTRAKLTKFYQKYDPSKAGKENIDKVLKKYAADHSKLAYPREEI